jgi:hypothetical protein
LIRDYFTGDGPFAEDPPEELARRRSEGAYVAQVHQRLKQYIKQVSKELRFKYQWPRRHSFNARISDLLLLGLLVTTGEAAPGKVEPQERGAGQLGSASRVDADGVIRRGFSKKLWVRVAPGADTRPEWADPLGYLIILKQQQDPTSYQNIRVAGGVLSTVTEARPRRPRTPRRQRQAVGIQPRQEEVAEKSAEPSAEVPERLAELEQERQALLTSAETLSETGISPDAFERLGSQVRAFNTTATRVYGQTPFPDLAEALELLQNCIAGLREQRQLTQLRVQARDFCRAAARMVAEALAQPLLAVVPPAAAPSAAHQASEQGASLQVPVAQASQL